MDIGGRGQGTIRRLPRDRRDGGQRAAERPVRRPGRTGRPVRLPPASPDRETKDAQVSRDPVAPPRPSWLDKLVFR